MNKIVSIFIMLVLLSYNLSAQDKLEKVSLQLHWKYQFQFAGFIMAKEKGFYKNQGLDVELREYNFGQNIEDEVLSGKANYGIYSSAILLSYLQGKPIQLMASFFKRSAMVIIAKPTIKSPKDLIGKTIMADTKKDFDLKFKYMFNSLGMDTSHLKLSKHTYNVDDFANDKVDAMTAFISDQPHKLDKLGIKYNILDPSDYGVFSLMLELFTSEKEATNHLPRTKKFKIASIKGWEYALNNVDETIKIIQTKYAPHLNIEDLENEAQKIQKLVLPYAYDIGSIDESYLNKQSALLSNDYNTKDKRTIDNFLFNHKHKEIASYTLILETILVALIIIFILIYRQKKLNDFNKKLEDQKELYDLVFENSSNGVLIIDLKTGKFSNCNNSIVEMLKYNSKDDILNLHPSDLSPQLQPDGRQSDEKANEMIDYTMKNGTNTFEWKHLRATGEEFWAEIILTLVIIEKKEFIHVVWKDIDEQKQSRVDLEIMNNTLEGSIKIATHTLEKRNKSLHESIENFQNLLDNTMEAIVLSDENNNIIDVNQSGIDMLGYDEKSEVIGTKIITHISESDLPILQKNIQYDIVAPYELTLLKKDATKLPTLACAKNIIKDGTKIRMSMLMNLTELKQKDQLIQQQTRLAQMGEMISMIAHQWRQPLGAISSSVFSIQTKNASGKFDLELKEDRDKLAEFSNKKLNHINEYVQVLSTTIDDFRNFFKPDKEKELVTLSTPIKRALQIVESSMNSKSIRLTTEFDNDDKVLMYQNEMMQVILNILKNAEDNFMEKNIQNPHAKIRTYKESGMWVISISDNGGGISEDILPNIFDPYFSTKDEKNGTGLGLYMSKIMVEEHNKGQLNVKNTEDGVCFEILLPTL